MAHRMWKHTCGCDRLCISSGAETCPRCGQPGEFAGWSRSVVELMGQHARRTGYPLLSDRAEYGWRHYDAKRYGLPTLKRSCPKCGGSGLLDIGNGQDYQPCDQCNGDGGLPNFPPEVMRAYQQKARELRALDVATRSGRSGGQSKT
jgi:ribosomal protein S27AE